jgi:hypothetical protein
MRYKLIGMMLLINSLLLSGCTQTPVYPSELTLSQLGPNPQEEMERLLAPQTISDNTQQPAQITGMNGLHLSNF